MCGIAGFSGSGSSAALHRMSAAIARRGPDDEGFYEADGVGFAFRRLSIIDVAGGHQPISNEDESVWVMLNGEIYGYGTLRDELMRLGHRFRTKSDTETIVHAYEEWGDVCFERLQGMFAIAIWDVKQERLILARDRLGKKPLHWMVRNGTLWFSSELKGLLASGAVSREIDVVSAALYFGTDAIPTPRTIFKGVQKMEPASVLIWRRGVVEKIWSFWKPNNHVAVPTDSRDILAELRKRIDLAVSDRLVTDVPLGLFLSGGIDSAVIAESASRQSTKQLKAFTIGFSDRSHDERDAAFSVAQALGLEYHADVLMPEAALALLEDAVLLLDEPLADSSILPQLFLSRFTRSQVTVALTGDGGDELLLGYQHIPAHVLMERIRAMPTFLRVAASTVLNWVPAGSGYFSAGFKLQRLARGLTAPDMWARDVAWRGACENQLVSRLFLPDISAQIQSDMAARLLADRANELDDGTDIWTRWSWAYMRTFLMDDVMVKVDRATMWFGLEGRAPLLDSRVVEFLLSLGSEFKMGSWNKKRLFVELLRSRVPSPILSKPKHGFAVPVAEWLRGPLKERLDEVTSAEYLRSQGLFSPETVQGLVREHMAGRLDRRKELWAVLMFQLWYRAWIK